MQWHEDAMQDPDHCVDSPNKLMAYGWLPVIALVGWESTIQLEFKTLRIIICAEQQYATEQSSCKGYFSILTIS